MRDWLSPGASRFMGSALSSHFQAVKPQLLQPIVCYANPGKTVPGASTFPAHRTNTATARVNVKLPARLQLLSRSQGGCEPLSLSLEQGSASSHTGTWQKHHYLPKFSAVILSAASRW